MIGSTEAGLKLSTTQFYRFNRELVKQIKPHLEGLGLVAVLLKFTGDGWLLMTDEEDKVPVLCCLATIMARRFQDEMAERTDMVRNRIPALRLAICSGRDVRVKLPDGREDWVGDSARRAVRASLCCSQANMCVIDEVVRQLVMRDFDIKPIRIRLHFKKHQRRKEEEKFPVYLLGGLKAEVVSDSKTPEYFVYTFGIIGEKKAAKIVVEKAFKSLADEARESLAQGKELPADILRRCNRLVASVSEYSVAIGIIMKMKAEKISPDVFTYSIMINKAPDYETAEKWLEEMCKADIEPNVWTYNTLVSKTLDYDTSKKWFRKMQKAGIRANVVTYNALIKKSPDYNTAEMWLEEMREASIEPNVVTYNTFIKKAPDYNTAEKWLEEMHKAGIEPNVRTYNMLADKAQGYDIANKWFGEMCKAGIEPNVWTYNTLVGKSPDYDIANKWFVEMCKAGIEPDVVTYNTLIGKAPDYETAKRWFRKMRKASVEPDVWTYNTLIRKSPDYNMAGKRLAEMREAGIKPDTVTYNTLISKAPDYNIAEKWVSEMCKAGVQLTIRTYHALFSKDLSRISADDILKWCSAQEEQLAEPIQAVISFYQKTGRIDQALRLVLEYPHLAAARKVIRKHTKKALDYFRDIATREPDHPSAAFALGVAMAELGKIEEAKLHLKQALKLASAPNMKALVEKWLQDLNARSSGKGA
jgi:tetratricopeptide (TPR) repeat protein